MKAFKTAALLATLVAAPSAFAESSIAGFYVGGNLGVAQPTMTIEDSDCWYNCSAYTNRPTGFDIGLKVGQNLTSGNFLFGWDFEYDFVGADDELQYGYYNGPQDTMVASGDFKSVVALKGKAGIADQDTALALVFGLAQADIESELRDQSGTPGNTADDYKATSGDVMGMVYGLSVQHAMGNLIVGADISKYAFETDTATMQPDNSFYKVNFVNDLDTFRVSVAYKFF